MTHHSKLNIIKSVHTGIWLFFNGIIFYLYYAVILNRIDKWVWLSIGVILMEGLVLLLNKKHCPLTLVARNYSDSKKDNFDIFLPNWLARYNKLIYTSLFVIALVLLALRILAK
jgi:hypothetical protein